MLAAITHIESEVPKEAVFATEPSFTPACRQENSSRFIFSLLFFFVGLFLLASIGPSGVGGNAATATGAFATRQPSS